MAGDLGADACEVSPLEGRILAVDEHLVLGLRMGIDTNNSQYSLRIYFVIKAV